MNDLVHTALERLVAFLDERHPGFADDPSLHAEARAWSEAYTTGAAPVGITGSVAYLAHFGPRAVIATARGLRTAPAAETVLEVGAGSGASALTLALAGARTLILCDPDPRALAWAAALVGASAEVVPVAAPLQRLMPRPDVRQVVSAFSVGELPGGAAEAYAALRRAAPGASSTVIVDAGDRIRARKVQELRGIALTAGERVLDPCPHAEACPALVRASDWCMSRLPKVLPDALARFSRGVGRSPDDMAASVLVLHHPRPHEAEAPAAPAATVVLGAPHHEKGRVRVPVCGPAGLRAVQALRRHPDAFARLAALVPGDVLPAWPPRAGTDTAHLAEVDP